MSGADVGICKPALRRGRAAVRRIREGSFLPTRRTDMRALSRAAAAPPSAGTAAPRAPSRRGRACPRPRPTRSWGRVRGDGRLGRTFHLPRFTTSPARPCTTQLRTARGEMNEEKDNVLVVCHALTGNAALDDWWSSFLGDGLPFDTSKAYVIRQPPRSATGRRAPLQSTQYGSCRATTFPVHCSRWRRRAKANGAGEGVKQVKCVIEAPGRMQTVSGSSTTTTRARRTVGQPEDCLWPDRTTTRDALAIPMACGTHHHTWQIAVSEAQRQCIYADPGAAGTTIPGAAQRRA